MAEVLSVIASGIAVAQVAGTAAGAVIKLKKLWDEVKNVPESVSDLMEQIDCLDPILWEAEQQVIQNQLPPQLWDDKVAIRSTKYCRKALQKLTCLADDLASQIYSKRRMERGISRAKVLLKKDRLRDLEQGLDSAVRILQLAQQGYLITLVKFQPDVIAYKVITELETVRQPQSLVTTRTNKESEQQRSLADLDTPSVEVSRYSKGKLTTPKTLSAFGSVRYRSTSQGFVVNAQPPYWLAGIIRAWSFNVVKSYSGWKFHLRNYSVRPPNSLVFRGIKEDNIQMLQVMFGSGEASPFDCNEAGSGILHYAVGHASVRSLKLIRDMKLDIDYPNAGGFIAADWARWYSNNRFPDLENQLEFVRLMSADNSTFKGVEDCQGCCRCPTVSNLEVFRKLKPIVCPTHNETSLLSRLHRTYGHISSIGLLKHQIIQLILGPNLNNDLDTAYHLQDFCLQPIHIIAVATTQIDIPLSEFSNRGADIESWVSFARTVIERSNLHQVLSMLSPSFRGIGPAFPLSLTALLFAVLWPNNQYFGFSQNQVQRLAETNLRKWLHVLKRIGIDLVEYGHQELRTLCQSGFEICKTVKVRSTKMGPLFFDDCYVRYYNLISLRIGPNVDDWSMIWGEPTDEFAGDFWNLIEDPVLRIPGSWYETEIEA